MASEQHPPISSSEGAAATKLASPGHDEFHELLLRVQGGSEDAASELFKLYGPHVVRAIRRLLNKEMRSKFDSADFAQSVWISFFTDPTLCTRVDRPEALVGLLTKLARNKVVSEYRRRMISRKRNVAAELPLFSPAGAVANRVPGVEPTPSQVAVAEEIWERLITDQPLRHRQILELRRAGMTNEEVGQRLGVSTKTVARVIHQVSQERL